MIEHIGLNTFIRYPGFDGREEIEFERNTLFGGLQLTHHTCKILIDCRKASQIISQVGTEYT